MFKTTFNNELYQEYLQEELRKKEPKNICINCGEKTNNEKYCSYECSGYDNRKVKEIDLNQLKILFKTHTYRQIGNIFNVSDNAVKKWGKKYNIEYIDKRKNGGDTRTRT